MIDVKGKWALITGAARGIGAGAAKFMAERGCNLILHGRTPEHCAKVLDEVRALGIEAYAVGAEFSDLSQVKRMLADIDALGKDIDIVLNNAGIQVAYRTEYLKTPAEDYEKSFLINTIAPMIIVYHFQQYPRSFHDIGDSFFVQRPPLYEVFWLNRRQRVRRPRRHHDQARLREGAQGAQ